MEHPIPDDDDLLLTIRSITFFPDNHIEAELVDGERISREMRSYSPGRGVVRSIIRADSGKGCMIE